MNRIAISTVAAAAFACSMLTPVRAADTANSLSDSLYQALLTRCLDLGTITPEQLELPDDQLKQVLRTCGRQASAPAPVYQAPTRERIVVATSDDPAPRAASFVRRSDRDASFSNSGRFGDIGPISIGNRDSGSGKTDKIDNPAPAPTPPVTPINPIDARIDGIQKALDTGIKNGSITPAEAQKIGGDLAAAKSLKANLGNTNNDKLILQQQLDKVAASTNEALHNNTGVPDPNTNAFAKAKKTATIVCPKQPCAPAQTQTAKLADSKSKALQTLKQKQVTTPASKISTSVNAKPGTVASKPGPKSHIVNHFQSKQAAKSTPKAPVTKHANHVRVAQR